MLVSINKSGYSGSIGLVLKRGGKRIAYVDVFGPFDDTLTQTDNLFTQEHEVVQKAQPGDTLFIYSINDSFTIHLQLLEKGEEAKPFFVYKCDLGHTLNLFYPDKDGEINSEWETLT